ncbi:MAG: High-affnity carbon uptake protein Hat/HatR [Cyclobacteriaceae bacterium]|nr:High-affnity carbon uptake protein Hat/HatR [Cyclobacteriaceae bacterium]
MNTIVSEQFPGTPSLTDVSNPFPGLRPFKIEESHLFFGREGQSDEVLLKLSKSRFVGVIGPSGSGKSSFIYCGVLPILYGGFLTDASPNWEVVVTRPGSGPIENLAESLLATSAEYKAADGEDKKIKRTIVSTLLRSSSLGLVEAIEQSRRRADINYLVLVDQFEELFRFKDGTDPNSVNETLAFVNLLMEAVNYTDAPIYVAITMRSDFIGDCAQFPDLTRKINDSHYLIPQLTRDQKRRAIEGPVAVGGARIAPRLVQQLLNDLGDNPDQLPILQHALMRTWSYWKRFKDSEDEAVDLKHYEAIGTMSEALSQHANEAYDELDEDQKRICEVLFKAITEKRGENFGIRRPTKLNEIAAIADVSEDEVAQVVEKFREPGRSLLTPAYGVALTGRSMIDISHESLMRIWSRLKNWVDDEADAVQMYQRLAEAAAQYQVGKAGLWRPPDLQLALNWQAKHKPTLVWGQRYHPAFERTMIFLEYSRKEFETEQRIKELEQKRKLQRARTTAIVLGAFLVVALIAVVYAFVQQAEAKRQAQIAQEKEELANRNAAEARMQRNAAIAAQKEADAQRQKAEDNFREAEKQRLAAEEAKKVAEEQRKEAEKQRNEANVARVRADRNAEEANRQKQEAERQRNAAQRARYLAQAKAMALKSQELGSSNPELEALLAQQAFMFNDANQGYSYDNDIYNGLFYALRNNNHPLTNSLAGHEFGAARTLVSHANDKFIYSGGSDGKIIRWSHSPEGGWTPNVLVDATKRPNFQVFSLDVTSDGKWLVAAGLNTLDATSNYVELYDLNNLDAGARKIGGYVYDVENISFTPDNQGFFARDNAGRSIKFSNLTTSQEVIKCPVKINAIDLSADGKKIAGAGENGSLYIWDVANNYAMTEIKGLGRHLTAVSWAPQGNQLIVGDESGLMKILVNNQVIRFLPGHEAAIEQIKYNHAGTFMASASKDKTVRIWNVKNLKEQPIRLADHSDWVWSLAFTPNDEQIMIGLHSTRQTVRQGQITTEESIRAYPTRIQTMANILCSDFIKRNLTEEEWDIYVGSDLDYEKTCNSYPGAKK